MRDSDDDAPLVRTQFAGGPPITVGGSSQLMLGLTIEEVGLVVEVAPNVVDATAVVLPPPDVVDLSWIFDCLRLIRWIQMMSSTVYSHECQVVCQWKQRSRQSVSAHATVEGLATDVDDDLDPSLVDALEFDLTRDHEEVLVQLTADSPSTTSHACQHYTSFECEW